MSVVGGSEKRPAAILYVGALLISAAIGGAAYVLLVAREDVNTQKQKELLTHIEEEVRKADDYLRRHQNPIAQRDIVTTVAEDVKKRIPYGPVDIQVANYIDTAAQQANIVGVHWQVMGGLKVPRNDVDKRTPLQRMALETAKLKSSVIDVTFTSRYKDCLAMLKFLSQSPYVLEIFDIDIHRDTTTAGSLNVNVALKLRYLYE